MNSQSKYDVGIDVCKDNLDCYHQILSQPMRYANNPVGIRQLLADLDRLPESPHLICEPTGGYEKPLLMAYFEHNIEISGVNARAVRGFARVAGQLEKTDAIDARTLCRFKLRAAP
ncbi:MAG: transposase [Verrucomicrobiota bacterium]